LRAELITRKKFNPKAVDEFILDFRETLHFAGLTDANGVFSEEVLAEIGGGVQQGGTSEAASSSGDLAVLLQAMKTRQMHGSSAVPEVRRQAPAESVGQRPPATQEDANVRELVIPLMEGETARLTVPVHLSEENYDYLLEQINVFKRGIVSKRPGFSERTKCLALERAGGKCEACQSPLHPKNFAAHHRTADGGDALANCEVLCEDCHRTADATATAT